MEVGVREGAHTEPGAEADAAEAGSGRLLRMRDLARATGVSAGAIRHYVREGLLPEPVRTSRNMAWYPREFVERVKLIKRLQEERFLPLKLIKGLIESDDGATSGRLRAFVELEDRIIAGALGRAAPAESLSATEVHRRFGVPRDVLERLEELEVLTPRRRGNRTTYGPEDVEIVRAIGEMRALGYSEALGFTVYDTLIYKRNLERMVREEADVMRSRLGDRLDPVQAADLITGAVEPVRNLIAAMRAKLLVRELKGDGGAPPGEAGDAEQVRGGHDSKSGRPVR